MQISLHGKFAKDYGSTHTIQATSIVDAIEGLSRQLGFYTNLTLDARPVARVVGHDTIDSMAECPDKIDIVPMVAGGKGVKKILIGAALIGLSFVTAGAASAFLAQTVTSALFGMGVGLALSGLAQMFIKAPTLSKETDPEASKYLGFSQNTTKLGTLRSYSMGRIKITSPHLLALNVDSNTIVRGEFPT